MKPVNFLLMALASFSAGMAQETPGPSPTESVGCEPHGDHWHCDAPATATSIASSVAATATSSHDDHDDHDHEEHDEHDEHDDHATPTMPSPTESVGCEPHGDHWHCDGPAETGAASASASASSGAAEAEESEGAAMSLRSELSAVVGLAGLAAALYI